MKVIKDNSNPFGLPDRIESHEDVMMAFDKATAFLKKNPELAKTVNISVEGNPITIRKIKDAATWANDQVKGVRDSIDKYTDGIQHPRKNPKEEALKKKGRWKNKIQEAIAGDLYAKGIQAYDLDEAIELAVSIGADNLVRGVEARSAKIRRTVERLVPLFTAVKDVIDRMPTDTAAEAEKKMVENLRLMREMKKKLKGG